MVWYNLSPNVNETAPPAATKVKWGVHVISGIRSLWVPELFPISSGATARLEVAQEARRRSKQNCCSARSRSLV